MNSRISIALGLVAMLVSFADCRADGGAKANGAPAGLPTISEADFSKAIRSSFHVNSKDEWDRFYDQTLDACNAAKDQVGGKQAQDIIERERKSIVYPKNGKLIGDWRMGQKWAEGVHGGRIGYPGFTDADDPAKPNEANCYACHSIAPDFPQAGNAGPALTGFGKLRGSSEPIVKYTYDKIYDAKSLNPCSLMPRYGGDRHLLTPEQVADLVAFLLDPESPVNAQAAAPSR